MFVVKRFMPTATTRLQDYAGTYYGELTEAENLVTKEFFIKKVSLSYNIS